MKRWSLAAVVLIPLAAHLIVAGQAHLTEDEAYYRLWSFAPALGYFDHPPMIAWWIWLGRRILGDTALAVRFLPSIGCAVTTLLVFAIARHAGATARTALGSALLYAAMPLVAVGGLLAVPDAPASLFWVLTLLCALIASRDDSTLWWLLAGIAAGLAALSKYSALFLAPGILLWLICEPQARPQLRRPGPWLAAGAALGLFGVNIAWNAQHHWETFAKQFGRIAAHHVSPFGLPEFLLGQMLLLNPLAAILAVRALAGLGRTEIGRPRLIPFAATSAPFCLYLVFHSLHDLVQAHWPAPIYPAIAVCAAAGASGAGRIWRSARRLAPYLGFSLAALAFVWVCLPADRLGLPRDPALSLRGWSRFSESLEQVRRRSGAAWIAAASYGVTAQLAGEPAIRAPVFELYERERYLDLAIPDPDLSRPGLVVDLPRRIDAIALRRCFADVVVLGRLSRGDAGGPFTPYVVLRVSGPRVDVLGAGCPTASSSSTAGRSAFRSASSAGRRA